MSAALVLTQGLQAMRSDQPGMPESKRTHHESIGVYRVVVQS